MEATIAELCVLAFAPARVVRVCASGRFVRAFPAVTVRLAGWLALYGGLVAGLATAAPVGLHALAGLALAAAGYERWRARPSYGRSRRLPLGRWVDDLFFWKQAKRHGPVFKTSSFFRPAICVVGLEQAIEILRSNEGAIQRPALRFSRRLVPGGFIRFMSPETHAAYRPVFQHAFARSVVGECQGDVAAIVRAGLARIATESARAPGRGAAPRPELDRMAVGSLARMFFGATPESSRLTRLEQLYGAMTVRAQTPWAERRTASAADEVATLVREEIAGEELPACFLRELLSERPEALEDETMIANLVFILRNGASDLTGLLHWLMRMLADHSAWIERMRAEPEADGLANRIVSETLRLEQSEYLTRRVTRELEIGDFTVPAGWGLRLCVRESHRDPAIFPEPHRFDPDRFLGRQRPRSEYSPFGAWPTTCLGDHATCAVAGRLVSELALGYDLGIARDAPREFDGFHWRPGSGFRVLLTPRGG